MNVPRAQNNHHQACAACKYQRRKCQPDCVLAPYFPANKPKQFINAHRLFGVSNIVKSLRNLNPFQKDEAMRSMLYEADARASHPVSGCVGIIQVLQQRLNVCTMELNLVNSQLMAYRTLVNAQLQLNQARMGLIDVNAGGARMGLIDVNGDGAGLIDVNGHGVKMIDLNDEGLKMGFAGVNDEGEGRDGVGLTGWVAQDIVDDDGGGGGGGEVSPSSFSHVQQTQSFLSLFDEAPLQTTVEECNVNNENPELEDVPQETGNENAQEPEPEDEAPNV